MGAVRATPIGPTLVGLGAAFADTRGASMEVVAAAPSAGAVEAEDFSTIRRIFEPHFDAVDSTILLSLSVLPASTKTVAGEATVSASLS